MFGNRKLEALDYPEFNNFEFTDLQDKRLRNLIIWLEDQKIRHYPVEGRDGLRNIESPDWPNHFQQYAHDVGVPFQTQNLNEVVDWLLAFAVKLVYADDAEGYSKAASKYVNNIQRDVNRCSISTNPLDQCDFNTKEFADGLKSIATKLQIAPHPDPTILLDSIAKLIKSYYSQQIVENPELFQPKGKPFPLMDFDMGFTEGDFVLKQAAKVVRILYIEELRDLQTKINEAIVAVQNITADPQVDTKLVRAGQFLAGLQKRSRPN